MSKAHKHPAKSPAAKATGDAGQAAGGPGKANSAAAPNLADKVAGPAPTATDGMMDVAGAQVATSAEAGGYYCEHTLFSTLEEAQQPGSSVVQGESGALAGFLHLPDDEETYEHGEVKDQGKRHEGTRKVVAAAFRGYFDQISLRGGVADGEPYRILITGYGTFMDSIRNNPTGDFVAHVDNITASMRMAFGDALVSDEPEQVNVAQTDRFLARAKAGGGAEVQEYYNATFKYQIHEPATCDTRDVLITCLRLPVTDQAIDPQSPGSVQDAMREFGPEAVLSMGVVPDSDFSEHNYRAETRADDQNLASDANHARRHDDSHEQTEEHASMGLRNAIRDGAPHVDAARGAPK
jgi:hypothetical protein